MKKKKNEIQKIIKLINSYNIPFIIALGIFLFGIKDPFVKYFKTYFILASIRKNAEVFVTVMLMLLYIIAIIYILLSAHYHIKTGRSYSSDSAKFKKTYSSLLHFWTTNDPYKMDIQKLPIEDWHNAEGVILGKCKDRLGNMHLVKRDSNACGNLASFGLPGSGKTTAQASTTAITFNRNINGGCGVFAISIKGDLLNFVKDKRPNLKVFTPDKVEGSCHYDPLFGVKDMTWTERRVFAENLSIIICPDDHSENSSFFVGGARNYLTAIILYLLHLHDTQQLSEDLKFPEITYFILNNSAINVTLNIRDCGNPIPGEYTNGYIGSNEKNVNGIWSHLCTCIRPFNTGALRTLLDGEGDCITPEYLNSGDVYIDVPQDKYDVYAPCMAIIVSNFLQSFMRRDDVSSGNNIPPIIFLLDEVVQLNLDFTLLSTAMATLRSKNVSLFLLMQSIAQLEGKYGEANARQLIDLCAYISVFNAQDPKSREYFQKLVGKRKLLVRSDSHSTSGGNKNNSSSFGVNESEEFIFEAADFGNLCIQDSKTKENIPRVLVYANGKYTLCETTPCYK